MITKKQKDNKIKLILLIILVSTEYARRQPWKNKWEVLTFSIEQIYWAHELIKIKSQKTFSIDAVEIFNDSIKREVIVPKLNTI